jgi:hypothetical protein
MSIIHDALKKVQTDLTRKNDSLPPAAVQKTEKRETLISPKVEMSRTPCSPASPQVRQTRSAWNFSKDIIFLASGFFILLFGWGHFIQPLTITALPPTESAYQTPEHNSHPPASTAPEPVIPEEQPLVVSGIMAMDDKHVALINDAIYEAGEEIEGQRILEITMEKVRIFDIEKGEIKTLKVTKK